MAERIAEIYSNSRPRVLAQDISHELSEVASAGKALSEPVFGDAKRQNFPRNSIRVKTFSTCGHEIESFGGPGSMEEAMSNTFEELVPGGVVIVRDFAKPALTEPIYMEILENEGIDVPEGTDPQTIDYNALSTQALLKRFASEFANGDAVKYEIETIEGKQYIKILPEWAHEFYLRKDYRNNWRQEIKEKYTYWTPEQAGKILKDKGYTNVQVVPDPNEYILKNRLEGKIALHTMVDGKLTSCDFPPTHMVVVGEKPQDPEAEINVVPPSQYGVEDNYDKLFSTINCTSDAREVRIGDNVFQVTQDETKIGTNKMIFQLEGHPKRVLKVLRKDTYNQHNTVKAMTQIVRHQKVLADYGVPHLKIVDYDKENPHNLPPYRYIIQEAAPEGSISAAQLIVEGKLTEADIQQMSEIVNNFELNKQWQLDTNPHSWFRVKQDDGTTQMVYASSKVYPYDERWEFKKIGLLQWIEDGYVKNSQNFAATIPKVREYMELQKRWNSVKGDAAIWKKYLDPATQPEIIKEITQ